MHTIRRAQPDDAEALARLFRTVRCVCLPYLPNLHTPDEDTSFFGDRVLAECQVWVAQADSMDGFVAFRAGWVDHLYVRQDRQRRGLGAALLALAMNSQSPLRLWVFQRNSVAIRFYDSQGFREIERTDGAGNEEGEPDMLMEWHRT
jgi:GNAT superfamily N-acetyltransferase